MVSKAFGKYELIQFLLVSYESSHSHYNYEIGRKKSIQAYGWSQQGLFNILFEGIHVAQNEFY